MNEDELKNIWRQEEKIPLKNIDMEWISQQTLVSKNELQRKLKWDVAANILFYILLIPLAFFVPKILFLIPFAAAIWIWYLWEIRRLYKYEADFQNFESVKSFLVGKEKLLKGYLTRSRYIAYFATPVIWMCIFAIEYYFSGFGDSILKFFIYIMVFLIANELIVSAMIEYYIRKIYAPVLDELRDLLQQLNDGST